MEKVILIPLSDISDIVVSDTENIIRPADGRRKLIGFTLAGEGWKMESEDFFSPGSDWQWQAVAHCPTHDLNATEEQLHVLCRYIKRSKKPWLLILPAGKDRMECIVGYNAKVSYMSSCRSDPSEFVFSGMVPYPVTRFEGEFLVWKRAAEWIDEVFDAMMERSSGISYEQYKESQRKQEEGHDD